MIGMLLQEQLSKSFYTARTAALPEVERQLKGIEIQFDAVPD